VWSAIGGWRPQSSGMAVCMLLGACGGGDASRGGEPRSAVELAAREDATVRVAAFNASLVRPEAGGLLRDLEGGGDPQARSVAAIVQRVRPDVIVLLEVDRDAEALAAFERQYLAVPQAGGGEAIAYAHRFVPSTNTGTPSGFDLDRDGRSNGPGDALGFGAFPGQYGMVVLSRYPIDIDGIRCFGELRWRDVPGARLPDDPSSVPAADWYSCGALDVLPLSSKNHCVVPVRVGERPLHVLASHPTPPVFDGAEDRNGLRNHDEIRLWAQLLDGGQGLPVVLEPNARFVIMGDLNADPHDGDSTEDPIGRFLLAHPRVNASVVPSSRGAEAAALRDGGVNASHRGPAQHDTADFPDADGGPGNLRVDYVLPSKTLEIVDSGVFWPAPDEPGSELVGASDHRLVWIDVR
jgi:endonuclease/exonuclease/phosphatase family metal-dependent hydrolase